MKYAIEVLRDRMARNRYEIYLNKRIIKDNPEIYRQGFYEKNRYFKDFNRELRKAINILKENSPSRKAK